MRVRLALAVASALLAALVGCGSTEEASVRAESVSHLRAVQRCPRDWPGPWTACPEAGWVERVTEEAGYRVTGETGSALIAQGAGRSFYIWATERPGSSARLAERESWPVLGRRAGVRVYGDEDLWRWWVARGFVLWLQAGPYETSEAPDLDELGLLIRASRELPPPGER